MVRVSSTFFLRAAWALSGAAIKPNAMLAHTIAMEKVLRGAFCGLAKWVVSMDALSIGVGGGSAWSLAGMHPAMFNVTCAYINALIWDFPGRQYPLLGLRGEGKRLRGAGPRRGGAGT